MPKARFLLSDTTIYMTRETVLGQGILSAASS